jgi:hypothetical protein
MSSNKDLERLEAWARDPLLGLSGDIDGLPPDLSANFQRYLDETLVSEPLAPDRTIRRP